MRDGKALSGYSVRYAGKKGGVAGWENFSAGKSTAGQMCIRDAKVEGIKQFDAERAKGFASLREMPQGTSTDIWYGTITLDGVPCYTDIAANGGNEYGCASTRADKSLDGKTARRVYEELKAA